MEYNYIPLDQVFVKSNRWEKWRSGGRRNRVVFVENKEEGNYLEVKIIKKVNPTVFKVADATGFRQVEIHGTLLDENKRLLKKDNFVKISGFGVDYHQKKVFLKPETIISKIHGDEFENAHM